MLLRRPQLIRPLHSLTDAPPLTVHSSHCACCAVSDICMGSQAPYQASITAVLSASSGVRTLQQDMSWTQPSIADTIPKVAAAMVEATRLLSAHKQQQQRGPPSPAPEQLQLLAGELLLWCLAVMGTALMRHEWVNGTSLQLCAVELAALLAQHLGLDPGSVTKEHSVTVFQVLDRYASCRLLGGSGESTSC